MIISCGPEFHVDLTLVKIRPHDDALIFTGVVIVNAGHKAAFLLATTVEIYLIDSKYLSV